MKNISSQSNLVTEIKTFMNDKKNDENNLTPWHMNLQEVCFKN